MEQRDQEKLSDRRIRAMFEGAGDFIARQLTCCGHTLWAYAIDGLISGSDAARFVFRPIAENLCGETMEELYRSARDGAVYNTVVTECATAEDVAKTLVNGFCVVLFDGVGALAYEVKTPVSRGPNPPEVENTVKGPKDAFVETIRINTSLIRRHLRTPDLRLYQTTVGRRSLTNVSVVWIAGITNEMLVEKAPREAH